MYYFSVDFSDILLSSKLVVGLPNTRTQVLNDLGANTARSDAKIHTYQFESSDETHTVEKYSQEVRYDGIILVYLAECVLFCIKPKYYFPFNVCTLNHVDFW